MKDMLPLLEQVARAGQPLSGRLRRDRLRARMTLPAFRSSIDEGLRRAARRSTGPCSGYVVWLAESIQGLRPAKRVNVKNASTARGTVFEPATTALVISSTV